MLAGCGGGDIEAATRRPPAAARTAATFNIAVNPWVGYEANAARRRRTSPRRSSAARSTKKDLKEEIAWQGFGTGEVDVVMENWGHDDLKKKYIDEQKTAVDAGPTGNKGVIGWYVPPWMAEKYPDITDWKNLNKYADLFKTSESGGKGQLLDGDPSFVTNDEALVKNLKLDYKVVYAGSEAALIQAFRQAEEKKKPLLGYFYEPQWFLSEVKLVKVNLPPYTAGLRRRPGEGRLRLPAVRPRQDRQQEVRRLRQPGVRPGQELHLDQRRPEPVAKYIAEDKMTPDEAAEEVGRRQPGQGRTPG